MYLFRVPPCIPFTTGPSALDIAIRRRPTHRINVSSHTIAPSPLFSYSLSFRAVSSIGNPFHTCAENASTPSSDELRAGTNFNPDGEDFAGKVKTCFPSSWWISRDHRLDAELVRLRYA